MSTVELIRARLATLSPSALEIRDDSAQHAGHAGAKEGGHYAIRIVAPCFAGLTTLQRHRLVYDAIGDLPGARIHALSITAKTPEET
ncbi:BolA family protein [Sulfuricystis thermophila]|uniref:BolA family protein n=1 Tax=Sulfuricystis thermophila TaxID=2496847 RepID=UPI0010366E2A|nr:BolA family protein [Sulfuricystis thermophila]